MLRFQDQICPLCMDCCKTAKETREETDKVPRAYKTSCVLLILGKNERLICRREKKDSLKCSGETT